MNFRLLRLSLILLSMTYLTTCGIKVDLPTTSYSDQPSFGAGDTTYIRISPDWDMAHGLDLSSPWDILIGADGYVFVADHAAPRIHVINAAGLELEQDDFGNDFSALTDLRAPEGQPIYPMAIDQDSHLNLFIADSSNRLLVWNQYLNNVGVDSVAAAVLMHSPADQELWVTNFDSIASLQANEWEVADIQWTNQNIETWLSPRYFWDASDSLEALAVTRFFVDPDQASITGVSSLDNMCYVADAHSNNILGLSYVPAALLLTGEGEQILVYNGTMTERTVTTGFGNGTVNDPKGMTHGPDGALYYVQWGENFSVHKVGGDTGFIYSETRIDDIMQIERYNRASDIALDLLSNVYVADTGNDRIQQFNSTGKFAYNIGMSKVIIDSTIYDSVFVDSELEITERDTSFQIEVADVLNTPRSVAVDGNGIVYIADTQNQRVMRYRLSTELDYTTEN